MYPLSLWKRVRVGAFHQQVHIPAPLILVFSPGRRDLKTSTMTKIFKLL
jgi:hypothetical protein